MPNVWPFVSATSAAHSFARFVIPKGVQESSFTRFVWSLLNLPSFAVVIVLVGDYLPLFVWIPRQLRRA